MTPEQKAAFIIAQAAIAMGEIAGMQAANAMRAANNLSPEFLQNDFKYASNPMVLGHNAVITFFQD